MDRAEGPAPGERFQRSGWKDFVTNGALLAFGVLVSLFALEIALRLAGQVVSHRRSPVLDRGPSDASTYRILCLGESTTADPAFSAEHSYPKQLERILNERGGGRAFTVINAGVPGTRTDLILEQLEENLDRYDPEIVVTMMGINDGVPIDPLFQVSDSLRVVKLGRLLYLKLLGAGGSTFDAPRSPEPVTRRAGIRYADEDKNSVYRAARQIAAGHFDEAEERLRALIEGNPDNTMVRTIAFGQMTILNYQRGDLREAERYRGLFNEVANGFHIRATTHNYRELKRRLDERQIALVAVQYPARSLEPLRASLGYPADVVFVDNEATFLEATRTMPLRDLYRDLFAAIFGHLTPHGNFLLAQNVADGVLTLLDGAARADATQMASSRTGSRGATIPGLAGAEDMDRLPGVAVPPDPGRPVPANGVTPIHIDFDIAEDFVGNFEPFTHANAPDVVHDPTGGGRLKILAGKEVFLAYDPTPDDEASLGYQDYTASFTWQSASPPTLAVVIGADSHRLDGDLVTMKLDDDREPDDGVHDFEVTVRKIDDTGVNVALAIHRDGERIDHQTRTFAFCARTTGEIIIGARAASADVFLDDFRIEAARPIPDPETEAARPETAPAARARP